MQFKPVKQRDYLKFKKFYESLTSPLADLNAMMMVAWGETLSLQYCIQEEEILYMTGVFEGIIFGWGPPVGKNVSHYHLNKLFDHLFNVNGNESSILYVWENYSLWDTLVNSNEWRLSEQSNEYLYSTEKIAVLSGEKYKSLRKEKHRFIKRYIPEIKKYDVLLKNDCLKILDRWILQKSEKIPEEYFSKFNLETNVCQYALKENLPLTGVVVYIDEQPQGFSLGYEHSNNCFNCMFEKTNLDLSGLSAFVFSSLAETLSPKFSLINAGEDWGIEYLHLAKTKWRPDLIQKSYSLQRILS